MGLLKYLGRAVQLILDLSIIMLALALVLVSAIGAACAAAYEAAASWIIRHGGAKARGRATWQQGI